VRALPDSWAQVPFDEAVSVVSDRGHRIKQKEYVSEGPLPVVDQGEGLIGGYTDNVAAKVEANKPVIVFGDHTRRFKYVKFPFAVGADGVKLFSAEDFWNPDFLFLQLAALDLEDRGYGRHYQHLRKKELVLAPLREQSRIVAKLEELLSDLDAGMAELRAAQKKLQQYRQSLLKAAVEGALTADWREAQRQQGAPTEIGAQLLDCILTERRARWEARQLAKFKVQGKAPPKDWEKKYPEPVQPDTTALPTLPEEWVWASVEQLGDVQLGRQRSPDKLTGLSPTRYIRAGNITEAGIDFSDVLEMDFSEQERETFRLRAGDVLLTEASGSAEHVGRPAVWPNIDGLFCFQNTVLRFTPQGVSSTFAFYSFLAMQKLGVFRRLSGGVGINHLSAGKFSRLPFALPPASEQVELVNSLDSQLVIVEERLSEIELSLKQATAQRHGILRTAFSGELVSQDPKDEPAAVLLERIRAERTESGKQVKARRTRPDKEIATLVNKLIDVLAEAADWVSAQEAFRRCGVVDGTPTDRIEELYAELRKLDKEGRLAVETVKDEQGRKLHDKLKLLAG
jgi:type I restriction enzyme S subunit